MPLEHCFQRDLACIPGAVVGVGHGGRDESGRAAQTGPLV
jgi:hypothetical protein